MNMLNPKEVRDFQNTVLGFYSKHRRALPWRNRPTAYRVLVSEFMLQQTQIVRVIPKFNAWMKALPNLKALALASQHDVLTLWQGLGYNRRALNLHTASQKIMSEFHGIVPQSAEKLLTLPGVGPYTAGAILAFAFNKPVVFLDTNIRRIYLHHFFSDKNGVPDSQLYPLIEETLYHTNPRLWYSALMDYGALHTFGANPNIRSRHYTKQSVFRGSRREIRSIIIKLLLRETRGLSFKELHRALFKLGSHNSFLMHFKAILHDLAQEGFLIFSRGRWRIRPGSHEDIHIKKL